MDRSVIYFLLFLSSKGVYPIISKRFIFKVKKTSFLAGETLHYIYNGVWMVQRLFKQFKEDSAHQIGCFSSSVFQKGGHFFLQSRGGHFFERSRGGSFFQTVKRGGGHFFSYPGQRKHRLPSDKY